MKKPILIAVLISSSLLSGCAGSLAGAAVALSSDLTYNEYQFHRNITAAYRILDGCNNQHQYGFDLSAMRARIQMDSEQTVMWEDHINSSFVPESRCDTWANRVIEWDKTGEMPLIGGSIVDPKWDSFKKKSVSKTRKPVSENQENQKTSVKTSVRS